MSFFSTNSHAHLYGLISILVNLVSSILLVILEAATHFLGNARALRAGQGFTVMRPARQATMGKAACCRVAAPMELTATQSLVPACVRQALWWVSVCVSASRGFGFKWCEKLSTLLLLQISNRSFGVAVSTPSASVALYPIMTRSFAHGCQWLGDYNPYIHFFYLLAVVFLGSQVSWNLPQIIQEAGYMAPGQSLQRM